MVSIPAQGAASRAGVSPTGDRQRAGFSGTEEGSVSVSWKRGIFLRP